MLASDRIDRLASSKHQSLSFVLPSLQRCCFYWNGLASARGNLSVILYTLRTTYTQRPWQKRLRSTAKLVGVSVFFGVVQSQDSKFTMPIYDFEAVPLEAILSAGIQNNLLVLDDVVAVGSTCISLLVCCWHHLTFSVWCARHRRYHQIGIFSTSLDPAKSLAIFNHCGEYALEIAEYQWEFFIDSGDKYSEFYGDDFGTIWRGFIVYRAWCILHGFEPELS